jgi:hypothetical protein
MAEGMRNYPEGSTSSNEWARSFIETLRSNPGFSSDLGMLSEWFANAIVAGYREGLLENRVMHGHERRFRTGCDSRRGEFGR